MRYYLTAVLLALVLGAGTAGASTHHGTAKKQAAAAVRLFWHTIPTDYSGTVDLGTVPAGKTWTIKYLFLVSEKGGGAVPSGGDGTVDILVDGIPLAETSLATGNRVAYTSSATDITLAAGMDVDVYYLSLGSDPPGYHFFGVSMFIVEKNAVVR